jgi:SAM-dependent methyltransferase
MKSTEDLSSEFDQVALTLAQLDPGGQGGRRKKHVLDVHIPAGCARALDIGCGLGSFARRLAARSEYVLAIDLSPEMIRLARERSQEFSNIDFQVGDIMTWELPAGSFDCVVSVTALHHMRLDGVLARIREAMRPGGVLLVSDFFRPAPWHAGLMSIWKSVRKRTAHLLSGKGAAQIGNAWRHDPNEKRMSAEDIRRTYRSLLPGTRLRFSVSRPRYTAIWQKPQ